MFSNIDLSLVQKKLVDNPKMSVGAASVVAAVALIYAYAKSGSNDIEEDDDGLPDYAQQDVDYEFTQRFAKKSLNRKRTISNPNNRPGSSLQNNKNKIKHNQNSDSKEESKDQDIGQPKQNVYSPLDPDNPNFTNEMDEEDENYDVEVDEGFSIDEYYVPFRVKATKTKRRPDAPFMQMFRMYANKEPSIDLNEEEYVNNDYKEKEDIKEEKKDGNDNDDENDNDKATKPEEDNPDIGTSPPLNPHIPSASEREQVSTLNGLDSLRERYYKKQLPKSFQSNALSEAFQSESQQAIQNDLNELEDNSLMGGIKQSYDQMITQSND